MPLTPISRQDVNEAGRPAWSNLPPIPPDIDNGKVDDNINQSWDWLFGIFYNREPTFDDSSLATILACVMGLIECAESVGAIDHLVSSVNGSRRKFSDDRTRHAPDGGLSFYLAIAEGAQAYPDHRRFQDFHKYFPMSIKACHVLEANMGVLKEDVKYFVRDLLEEHTHLKRDEYEIHWLTCATIDKKDLPWYTAATPKGKVHELKSLYDTLLDENARGTGQIDKGKGVVRTPMRGKKRTRMIGDDDDGSMFIDTDED
ncbi:uncharacterized protein Z518_01081 [Rhinocladiella mackenziei CBS 650.93]|uniref:Rhinocladiella mackenziei CBS 650.93 unplaced genomic scaffold supercont1.1, whole genome shotgun sequence n=1 Tax=Rhinocladiella mackenziei CBS 650.93 TaxID=1442369 RepID=A0A0D2JKN5_9EURO|nr:uncharacterized protein Z518_01081 [Rhinocladiella mackenziei CBS 650.93]KIX10000.1 hypothetical protein Z518_01081 [Rhinocladiella mackenziei CBS 650.93]